MPASGRGRELCRERWWSRQGTTRAWRASSGIAPTCGTVVRQVDIRCLQSRHGDPPVEKLCSVFDVLWRDIPRRAYQHNVVTDIATPGSVSCRQGSRCPSPHSSEREEHVRPRASATPRHRQNQTASHSDDRCSSKLPGMRVRRSLWRVRERTTNPSGLLISSARPGSS